MAHTKLLLAGLCLTILMTASAVSAAACPPDQTFSGTLTPGSTATIPVTTTVQGNTYFQFIPKYFCGDMDGQDVSMTVGSLSASGDCSFVISIHQAAAGTYTVTLRGDHLGVDGLAVLPYQLVVGQTKCQ